MSKRKLTQKELAVALGVSQANVTKLKARGMPVHSIEAARRWRDTNLDPLRAKWLGEPDARNTRPPIPKVAAADSLGLLSHIETLGNQAVDKFADVAPYLRQAMKALPPSYRGEVQLPLAVWEMLTADFASEMARLDVLAGTAPPTTDRGDAVTADEVDVTGEFWYLVAIGSIRPSDSSRKSLTGE